MGVAQCVTPIFFVDIFRYLRLYMGFLLYICNIFVTRLN